MTSVNKLTDYKTPEALIKGRMQALEQGDFSLIYDSYHSDAPFLNHFPDKSDYLTFADQQLREILLADWKIMDQRRTDSGGVEILLWMRIGSGPEAQDLFELALLVSVEDGWRYHSAQKLTREEYGGAVEQIRFHHFDQAPQIIRF